MADLTTTSFWVAVVIGALLAVIYSLRVLFLLDSRIARMEEHIERMAKKILREEINIERKLKKRR